MPNPRFGGVGLVFGGLVFISGLDFDLIRLAVYQLGTGFHKVLHWEVRQSTLLLERYRTLLRSSAI